MTGMRYGREKPERGHLRFSFMYKAVRWIWGGGIDIAGACSADGGKEAR